MVDRGGRGARVAGLGGFPPTVPDSEKCPEGRSGYSEGRVEWCDLGVMSNYSASDHEMTGNMQMRAAG